MTRPIVGGWRLWRVAAAAFLFSGAAAAQDGAPAACACRSDSDVVWAEFEMTADNIAALRRALSATGAVLEGQVLAISNRCPNTAHCTDRDWKPLGAGPLRLKVVGHVSSPGLFEGKRLRLEALDPGATLTVMGQSQ